MAHPYSVREIARQAGVSDATVDRVLHDRPGVRQSTVGQVRQAIKDLEAQRLQLELTGRRFMVDVVADAPARFTSSVKHALEAVLPLMRPAVFRARFHLHEQWNADDCVAELDRIAKRGSHGVILKAPDVPSITAAVDRLAQEGIPVVTLVTDLPASHRAAYVGMDNRSAGATAAYLIHQWMGTAPGTVAVTVSNDFFRGEEEREMGFRAAMRAMDPGRTVLYLPASDGLDQTARRLVGDALAAQEDLRAVYSIGGGNAGSQRSLRGRRTKAGRVHRPRPRPGQRRSPARGNNECRAAPRSSAGHPAMLPHHHARPRCPGRRRRRRAVKDRRHHTVQHSIGILSQT